MPETERTYGKYQLKMAKFEALEFKSKFIQQLEFLENSEICMEKLLKSKAWFSNNFFHTIFLLFEKF